MGSQTSFYEVFLALTNARLGAWLPNPEFVRRKLDSLSDWRIPGFPRIRRLSYYFREVFGIHPDDSRMLLCTDGGHYDNLGLVEMLRRRPSTVICIDGSAQTGPLNGTLARAIAMAWEELGVVIKLDRSAFDLVPGTGHLPDSPSVRQRSQASQAAQLEELNARLSASALITGTIEYPDDQQAGSGQPNGSAPGATTEGESAFSEKVQNHFIFAQAALTGDMPYEVLHFPRRACRADAVTTFAGPIFANSVQAYGVRSVAFLVPAGDGGLTGARSCRLILSENSSLWGTARNGSSSAPAKGGLS